MKIWIAWSHLSDSGDQTNLNSKGQDNSTYDLIFSHETIPWN